MKRKRILKMAMIGLLLAVPLLLSGCQVQPEPIVPNQGGNFLDFPTFSPETTRPPVRTSAPYTGGVISEPVVLPVQTATTAPVIQNNWYTVGPGISTVTGQTNVPTVTEPPPPATTPTATPAGSLKLGSKGDDVKTVQRKLKDLGFYRGSVDGDFGAGTEDAVKRFQKQYGLTEDGKVGKYTMEKLVSARATARPSASPTARRTATPRPTATPAYSDNTYLRRGDTSSKVRQMQDRLISLGYLAGKSTASFDGATEAAVIAFQKRNCSYYDGVAGPETLKALYSSSARSTSTVSGVIGVTLRQGDEGAAVRAVQTRLKALGYYKGTVDGSYGTGSVEAVKAFQRTHKLTTDGAAGGSTLNALFSTSAKTATAAGASATATRKPTATPRAAITPRPTRTPLPANTYVLVTPPPDGQVIYVTLQRGHHGTLVEKLQKELKAAGYYTGTADGFFGEGTENAVKAFQRAKGLMVDGVAGTATLRRLYQGNFPDGI